MEEIVVYGYLLGLVIIQYVFILPLGLFLGVGRREFRFSKIQWILYWLPYGFWIYTLYRICEGIVIEIDKIFNNYEK